MKKMVKKSSLFVIIASIFILQCGMVLANEQKINPQEVLAQDVNNSAEFNIQPRSWSATVTGNGVRVRSNASTSSTIIGLLYKGDKVEVRSTVSNSQGTWCYITKSSGNVAGYVSRQYLDYID